MPPGRFPIWNYAIDGKEIKLMEDFDKDILVRVLNKSNSWFWGD